MSQYRLVSFEVCPYGQRSEITLQEKEVPIAWRPQRMIESDWKGSGGEE